MEFVRANTVGGRSMVEGTNGADIGQVPAHFRIQHFLDVGSDLCCSASSRSTEIMESSNFFSKSYAPGTMNYN